MNNRFHKKRITVVREETPTIATTRYHDKPSRHIHIPECHSWCVHCPWSELDLPDSNGALVGTTPNAACVLNVAAGTIVGTDRTVGTDRHATDAA